MLKRIIAALVVAAAIATGASASSPTAFQGDFENGITAWTSTGGGAQCSNYGTPSSGTHFRGTLTMDTSVPGQALTSGRFYLAAQSAYSLEACDTITGNYPNTLGVDEYAGLMVRVPTGSSWGGFGDVIEELHFVNVLSAPVELVAWPNRLEIALETGACTTTCQYRAGSGHGPKSVVPAGVFTEGGWWETIIHVHWAKDGTGVIQSWYRAKGATAWTVGGGFSGIPTEQWASGKALPPSYINIIASYTAKLSSPLTIWLDNEVIGSSLAAVQASMP